MIVGLGLAEGIIYSSDFYYGIATADAYVVRFISCVALHAFGGAATALMISHGLGGSRDSAGIGPVAATSPITASPSITSKTSISSC